jgi:hypothetical protein
VPPDCPDTKATENTLTPATMRSLDVTRLFWRSDPPCQDLFEANLYRV